MPVVKVLSLSFVLLWGVAGCKQGEGERCEIDTDCESGLTCDNPLGTGGQCRSPGGGPSVDAAVDSLVPVDGATSPDSADTSMADSPEAETAIDATPETGSSDGTAEAGTDTDAALDAIDAAFDLSTGDVIGLDL